MGKLSEKIKELKGRYIPIELPSGRFVNIRRLTVGDLKELLVLKDTRDLTDDEILFETLKLISSEPDIVSRLPVNDVVKLLVELRKLSSGKIVELTYKCEKCQGSFEVEIDLDKDFHFKPFESGTIKVNEMVELEVFDIPFETFLELRRKYGGTSEKDNFEYNLNYIIKSVAKIKMFGEEIEDFTDDELRELIESLPTDEFENLINEFSKRLGEFYFEKKVKCPYCRHETNVGGSDLSVFLPF